MTEQVEVIIFPGSSCFLCDIIVIVAETLKKD
jgi:hypothetical protein